MHNVGIRHRYLVVALQGVRVKVTLLQVGSALLLVNEAEVLFVAVGPIGEVQRVVFGACQYVFLLLFVRRLVFVIVVICVELAVDPHTIGLRSLLHLSLLSRISCLVLE